MDNKDFRFIIVSPRQEQGRGGPIALYALCKNLTELGYDAKILYSGDCYNYKKGQKFKFWYRFIRKSIKNIYKTLKIKIFGTTPYLNNPYYESYIYETIKDCKYKILPCVDDNDIVIYPELMHGNFTNAKNVVRWLLYYNKYDDEAYSKKDMFWCYREVFNDYRLNPTCRTLWITYFNLDLYKKTNYGERKGKCYIIRKGEKRADLPKTFDGIIIDDLPETEKVKVMNECEYCISYDTQTAYSTIAAICGCISVVIPEPGKSKQDYRNNSDDENFGVAWGFEPSEIEYAKTTMAKAKSRYEKLNANSKENARIFAEECIKYFSQK